MNRHRLLPCLCASLIVLACRQPWSPETVARWDGGEVDLASIELHLDPALDRTQSGEVLAGQYRAAAEDLCIRDHLLRHPTGSDPDFDLQERELARRQIAVSSWVRHRLLPQIEVSDEQIETFYRTRPEASHRPERRMVAHIFRRTDEPGGETAAREVLDEARSRYLNGESLHTLAVEYSQSETASSGGILGLVSRGDLHQSAEDAIFALETDEMSRPIPVHGGLAVFVVTQVYPAKDFPLADVRDQIAQQLRQSEVRRRLDTIAETADLPADASVVPEERFQGMLESDEPGSVLYSDPGLTISVGDWRRQLTAGDAASQTAQYAGFLRLQRLYGWIVRDAFLDDPNERRAIEDQLEKMIQDRSVDRTVHERLIEKADSDRAALESWFEDNRERYQSSIELLTSLIVVEPWDDVEKLDVALRSIASSHAGGELERAAASIPGATTSREWLGIADLDAYHPRLKASLLTLEPPACGPVFNIGGILHLFCVEDRKDPQQLSFEEARDRVVADYVAANEQELYAEIKQEILDEESFEFNEERVREVLHAPAASVD